MTDPATVVAKALLSELPCAETYPEPDPWCDCVTDRGERAALVWAGRKAAAVVAALRDAGHLS